MLLLIKNNYSAKKKNCIRYTFIIFGTNNIEIVFTLLIKVQIKYIRILVV